MLKAVIIDDEIDARKVLKRQIEKASSNITIEGEAEGVKSGVELIIKTSPDLVFLDIQMVDGTAFELLETISKNMQINFNIIFTTAYDQYAIKAFKYSAVDYLLKPIIQEELEEAIKKVKNHKLKQEADPNLKYHVLLNNSIYQNTLKKIIINTHEKVTACRVSDIIYCESNKNYTSIHIQKDKRILTTKTLKEYEELLKEDNFCRVHNSFLVNVSQVDSFIKSKECVLMADGSEIPVSRNKREELLQMLSHG